MSEIATVNLTTCPTTEDVSRFYDGVLSLGERWLIYQHLSNCETCRKRIRKVGMPLPARQMTPYTPLEIQTDKSGTQNNPFDKIGPYRIIRVLGQGGMGMVFEAKHEILSRLVALKVLTASSPLDSQYLMRFRREVLAVGSLHHPNIVTPTDAGEHTGTQYLAMELIRGTDLSRLVRTLGALPVPDVVEILRQSATGLAYLHSAGLVHRDVKPSNLMVSQNGVVKLLDLGLVLTMEAKISGMEDRLTGRGKAFLGTHDYMAPEQWVAPAQVDASADIYSLGCVAYHILTGLAPYSNAEYLTPHAKMTAHLQAPIPKVRLIRNDAPKELTQLVEEMMAKSPDARPSAEEVIAALEPLRGDFNLPKLLRKVTLGPVNDFDDASPTNAAPHKTVRHDDRTMSLETPEEWHGETDEGAED